MVYMLFQLGVLKIRQMIIWQGRLKNQYCKFGQDFCGRCTIALKKIFIRRQVYLGTTATACAACGLLQIAELVPEYEKALYYDNAEKMLTALVQKHCDWKTETDGILQNGTVRRSLTSVV